MTNDIFNDGKILVTSLCGPFRGIGVERTQYQLNIGAEFVNYEFKQILIDSLKELLKILEES